MVSRSDSRLVVHRGVARNRKNFATGGGRPIFLVKIFKFLGKREIFAATGGHAPSAPPPTWLRPWKTQNTDSENPPAVCNKETNRNNRELRKSHLSRFFVLPMK